MAWRTPQPRTTRRRPRGASQQGDRSSHTARTPSGGCNSFLRDWSGGLSVGRSAPKAPDRQSRFPIRGQVTSDPRTGRRGQVKGGLGGLRHPSGKATVPRVTAGSGDTGSQPFLGTFWGTGHVASESFASWTAPGCLQALRSSKRADRTYRTDPGSFVGHPRQGTGAAKLIGSNGAGDQANRFFRAQKRAGRKGALYGEAWT